MIESFLDGVDFIAANTDLQALEANQAPVRPYPVTTSSAISRMPYRLRTSRIRGQ